MTYLVVGIDRSTFAGWHANVQADGADAAMRLAIDRARERGVDLVVAAAIGPGTNVVVAPAGRPQAAPKAA
jgi:hypothetical protein